MYSSGGYVADACKGLRPTELPRVRGGAARKLPQIRWIGGDSGALRAPAVRDDAEEGPSAGKDEGFGERGGT